MSRVSHIFGRRIVTAASLAVLMLAAGGCTKFKTAYDWVSAADTKPEVARVGADNPDLYQRALPAEMMATNPEARSPAGARASGASPAYNPQAAMPSQELQLAAAREPMLPDLPPQPVRKVASAPPPQPQPQPRVASPRAPVEPVRRAAKVALVQTAPRRSVYADPLEPDEMLAAQQSVNQPSLSAPPAVPPPRPIKVASIDATAPVTQAPRTPSVTTNATPPPATAPLDGTAPVTQVPQTPSVTTNAPPPPATAPLDGTAAISQKPVVREAVGPKKNAGRSSRFDWLLLDKGRHTRELTPVERLRATRRLLAQQRTAAMVAPSETVAGATPQAGLGLRGPADLGAAPSRGTAQASLQTGSAPTGLAQTATPQKTLSTAPNGTGTPSGVPSRERPMRIYFAPGKKKLSSQTITSIMVVAEAQRTVKRPVHVVGVAAAKGGEGNGFTTDALNRLALGRANAVAKELTANGVAKKFIVIHAQQEHRTDAAAGGTQTARSRRVDIYLE